jgi:hypothetical protein
MRLSGIALLVVLLATSSKARALPEIGSQAPELELLPVEGDPTDLKSAFGRPTLIVYESRATHSQNWPFKKKLKDLVQATASYRDEVVLFAIADVEGYDFWPVRGFAAEAVRSEAKRIGWPIYCDWKGDLRKGLDIDRDKSTVILLDRRGKVLFASEGPLPEEQQQHVLDLLREQLHAPRVDK